MAHGRQVYGNIAIKSSKEIKDFEHSVGKYSCVEVTWTKEVANKAEEDKATDYSNQ